MAVSVNPHLMFEGDCEAAIKLYTALFESSAVLQLDRYGPGEQGKTGTVKRAQFSLCGQVIDCIDSPIKHAFSFTPAMSLYVECESPEEQRHLFDALSQDGKVLMPLNDYGFSQCFGWVEDRFGVSWQLNLAG